MKNLSSGATAPPPSLSTAIKSTLSLAMPLAFGMLMSSISTLVDALFISHFAGSKAFAGVSTVFPFVMLLASFAAMVSHGVSVNLSRMSSQQPGNTNTLFTTGLIISVLLSAICTVVATSVGPALIEQAVRDISAQQAAWDYLLIMAYGCAGVFVFSLLNDIHRALQNKAVLGKIIVVSAASNLLLNTLFMAVLDWGVSGAAWATLIAQALGILVAVKALPQGFRLAPVSIAQGEIYARDIIAIGFPTFVMYVSGALVMLVCTATIAQQVASPADWLAAYGMVSRINIVIMLPLFALAHSCQTKVATAAGVNDDKQVLVMAKAALTISVCYLTTMTLLIVGMSDTLASILTESPAQHAIFNTLTSIVYRALPLCFAGSIMVCICQALAKPKIAMLLSLSKAYFILLPLLMVFSAYLDFAYFWYAFPIADGIGFIITLSVAAHLYQAIRREVANYA